MASPTARTSLAFSDHNLETRKILSSFGYRARVSKPIEEIETIYLHCSLRDAVNIGDEIFVGEVLKRGISESEKLYCYEWACRIGDEKVIAAFDR